MKIGDLVYCRNTRDSKNLKVFEEYLVTDINTYGNIQVKEKNTGKTLEHYYKPERFRLVNQELKSPKTAISLEKQYETREGNEVKILAISDDEDYPVIGQIKDNGKWVNQTWTREGKCFCDGVADILDLIEQKPKQYWFKAESIWINKEDKTVEMQEYIYSFEEILLLAKEIQS